MRKKLIEKKDVTTTMVNLETWNDCPDCGRAWKDKIATIGILHRTRLCSNCIKKNKD